MGGSRGDIRIGVIGVGGRGSLAGFAHRPDGGYRIVAGADTNPAELAKFRARYNPCMAVADYREMLANGGVDAVFVCTPDWLHEEHAVAALEAGKAVYLEKPMAITLAGCDRILEAARANRAKLYLGHNMRHMNFVLVMKRLIGEGAIGEVKAAWCRHFVGHGGDFYFKDWHADRSKSTGLLLQKAAHDIDVIHWLCGGFSRRVVAMGGLTVYGGIAHRRGDGLNKGLSLKNWPPLSQKDFNPVVDVEDLSMMLMELDNGVMCSYQQCHYTPDYWRNYTVIGTEGRMENFGDTAAGAVVKVWNRRGDYRGEADIEIPAGGTSEDVHGGADARIVGEFIGYVRGECAPSTSPVAARYSVAAACLATESLRGGSRPMDVPVLPREIEAWYAAGA